ncbi:MAG: hypothetical protein AAF420_16400 [Pseudomonadota bacterium]
MNQFISAARFTVWGVLLAVLAGCASHYPRNTESGEIYAGATVGIQTELEIPDFKARVYFQHGKALNHAPSDRWTTYCSVLVQNVQYPDQARQVVQPGDFGVVRVKQSNDYNNRARVFVASVKWSYDPPSNVTYKTELRLASPEQPDVRSLICEKRVDAYGRYQPSFSEIRAALGEHVKIQLP